MWVRTGAENTAVILVGGSQGGGAAIETRGVGTSGKSVVSKVRTDPEVLQLRPSGAAYINGKRVDVVTEGTLIDQGASIRVVALEGIRVVVREIS